MGPLRLRTGIVVAVTAIAATGLFGAGVMVGNALDDSDGSAPSGYQVDVSASARTAPGVKGDTARDADERNSPRRGLPAGERSGTHEIPPPIPIEERLNRALLIAREVYIDEVAVTRYQKAHKNEVAYGFCKAGSSGRYRCTVVELEPRVDPRQQKQACLRTAINRRQRRKCAQLPALSRSQSTIEFDVSLDPDGCWLALRPGKIDPTGSAKLEGCLSSS